MFKRKNNGDYVDGELPAPKKPIQWRRVRLILGWELITLLSAIFLGGAEQTSHLSFWTGFTHGIIIANLILWAVLLLNWPRED